MILSCPDCSTRYRVDPASIGPQGRKVRCSKCGRTWVGKPEAAEPAPGEPPLRAPAGARADGLDAALHAPARAEAAAARQEARRQSRAGPRARQPERRRGRGWATAVAWLLLIVVVGAVVAGGYLMRDRIVATWPATARLYAMAGVGPEPFAHGLELRNVKSTEARSGEDRVLEIEGEIANVSSRVLDVPNLRGALFDRQNNELQHWIFAAPENRLLPGETKTFRTAVRNPKPEAARLTIVFHDAR
jgi:predicted Zn finger-like uncharacterized protein